MLPYALSQLALVSIFLILSQPQRLWGTKMQLILPQIAIAAVGHMSCSREYLPVQGH